MTKDFLALKIQFEAALVYVKKTGEKLGAFYPEQGWLFRPGYAEWASGTKKEDVEEYMLEQMLEVNTDD